MFPKVRTFPCPNCKEIITHGVTQCRFCLVPVDPGVADLVTGRQENVNQAVSDASYLRSAAVAMFGFLAVGMVLTFAYWGFVGTFVVVGVQLLRWQIKFSDLLTSDPDYHKAKRSKNISFVLFLVAAPVGLIMNPFWDLILSELGM